MYTAIGLAATVALGFVLFRLGRLHQRVTDEAAVRRWRLAGWWSLAVGLALTIVLVGVIKEVKAARLRDAVATQIAAAEALAKEIPKGCPKGVDAEWWNGRVEAWRTETARIPGLEQTFPADKGDYPHTRSCRIEWVRNRLDYFAAKLGAVAAALVAR